MVDPDHAPYLMVLWQDGICKLSCLPQPPTPPVTGFDDLGQHIRPSLKSEASLLWSTQVTEPLKHSDGSVVRSLPVRLSAGRPAQHICASRLRQDNDDDALLLIHSSQPRCDTHNKLDVWPTLLRAASMPVES